MLILGLGAHFILGIFGPGYARIAALPMRIMVLAYLPVIPNLFYIAVARATNNLSRAAALVTVFTVLDIIAVVAGAVNGGLVGMSVAELAVITAEALVTTPIVLRAASGLGKHRRTAAAVTTSPALLQSAGQERRLGGVMPWPDAADRERQQVRALAVLVSLATPNALPMMVTASDSDQEGRPRMSKGDP
jgi:hypothetical protein